MEPEIKESQAMTRKHFQALADSLASTKPLPEHHKGRHRWTLDLTVWRETCEAIADACNQFNDNFDRCEFLAACGC